MKKILLLSVACLLFAGSQISFAQTKASSQTISNSATVQDFAKEKTNDVVNMFLRTDKLNAEQQNKIYDIFSSVEKKVKGVEAITDSSLKSEKQAKMQQYINDQLKTVLTDTQYTAYLKNMPK